MLVGSDRVYLVLHIVIVLFTINFSINHHAMYLSLNSINKDYAVDISGYRVLGEPIMNTINYNATIEA